mmetsp:Transcript_17719/g.54213  ORF Transcript_17719/g.54213 Transcript_17719/m.54213 type:complete len:202 (+) Transcript_17719:156-761(+)
MIGRFEMATTDAHNRKPAARLKMNEKESKAPKIKAPVKVPKPAPIRTTSRTGLYSAFDTSLRRCSAVSGVIAEAKKLYKVNWTNAVSASRAVANTAQQTPVPMRLRTMTIVALTFMMPSDRIFSAACAIEANRENARQPTMLATPMQSGTICPAVSTPFSFAKAMLALYGTMVATHVSVTPRHSNCRLRRCATMRKPKMAS